MRYQDVVTLTKLGFFGPWGPDDIPRSVVQPPATSAAATSGPTLAAHLVEDYSIARAFMDNERPRDVRKKLRAILKRSEQMVAKLAAAAEEWFRGEFSPSPVLWFFWCISTDRAQGLVSGAQLAATAWQRRKYWDEFGDKYQRTREVWTVAGKQYLERWSELAQRLLNVTTLNGISEAQREVFPYHSAVELAKEAHEQWIYVDNRITRMVDRRDLRVWLYDWKPVLRIKGAVPYAEG